MVEFNIKNEISSLFNGVCTVYENSFITDYNGIERSEFKAVFENLPCRLSTKSIYSGAGGEVNKAIQEIKLFLLNDVFVNVGSRISVTQNGISRDYRYTGVANVYSNHQELALECIQYG